MKLLIVALIRNEAADLSFLEVCPGLVTVYVRFWVGRCVCMLGPRLVTVYVC